MYKTEMLWTYLHVWVVKITGGAWKVIPRIYWELSVRRFMTWKVEKRKRKESWDYHDEAFSVRFLFKKVLNPSSPALLSSPKLQSGVLKELSAVQLSSARLSLLFCVSLLLRQAGRPWRSLKHTARVYNEGWVWGCCIYMREYAVYREELLNPPWQTTLLTVVTGTTPDAFKCSTQLMCR